LAVGLSLVSELRAAALIDVEAGVHQIVSEQSFTPVEHAGAILADALGNALRLANFTDCMLASTADFCVAVMDNSADGFASSDLRTDLAFPTNESSLWFVNDEPAVLLCSFSQVAWPQPRSRAAAFTGLC
jgi:hypothetical protein